MKYFFKRVLWLLFSIAIIGSVFFKFDSFLDPINDSKNYFSTILISIIILFLTINYKKKLFSIKGVSFLLWLLFFVGLLESCYGILQYFGIYQSQSYYFITGHFNSSTGFSTVLAMIFPIYCHFVDTANKNIIKRVSLLAGFIILLAVFLSKSRIASFGIIITILIYYFNHLHHKRKLDNVLIIKYIIIIIPIVLFLLIGIKKDSTYGRFQIWNISWKMVQEKPWLGHGYHSFEKKYMNYQADYFLENKKSQNALLADNIKHPFNEYLLVLIEFGFLGLFIFLFIIYLFVRLLKTKSPYRLVFLCIWCCFGIISFFSYPLNYGAVWMLLFLSVCIQFLYKQSIVKNKLFIAVFKFFIISISIFLFYLQIKNAYYEIKWNEIAKNKTNNNQEQLFKFKQLYPHLRNDAYFLYHYAVKLNEFGSYRKSLKMVNKCSLLMADYNLQLLWADNLKELKEYELSIVQYKKASDMIPSKFYPLYQIALIYEEKKDTLNLLKMARHILEKKVKIPSYKIARIKGEMNLKINSLKVSK